MEPYFSVITPSFNQGPFIAGCLESVQAQGDGGFEHLVFDNCSTDETTRVVTEFPHVHFVSEPDRGQSHAVNKGLACAKGEIICWLNSDDAYPPGVFACLRKVFGDPKVNVVFGDALQVTYEPCGEVRAPGRFDSRLDLVRWWSSAVKLHQPAIFFRRSILAEMAPLREDLHYVMDYEFWWRLSEKNDFHYLPEILAIQHRQPGSKTIRAWHKVYEERERVFAPFYNLIDGGDGGMLMGEKRREMGRRYLSEAFATASSSRMLALQCLVRSFSENPGLLMDVRWLGVLRRIISGG